MTVFEILPEYYLWNLKKKVKSVKCDFLGETGPDVSVIIVFGGVNISVEKETPLYQL